MFSDDECVRCVRLSCSFYGKDLAGLCAALEDESDAKKAKQLQAEWQEADASLAKLEAEEELSFDEDVKVECRARAGYRMSLRYGFIPSSEFVDTYAVTPKSCGYKEVSKFNEDGSRVLVGVAFRPVSGDEYKHRVFETFFETTNEKHETLMRLRLRAGQPNETFKGACQKEAALHPAVRTGVCKHFALATP